MKVVQSPMSNVQRLARLGRVGHLLEEKYSIPGQPTLDIGHWTLD
jgi:hypothetical protein